MSTGASRVDKALPGFCLACGSVICTNMQLIGVRTGKSSWVLLVIVQTMELPSLSIIEGPPKEPPCKCRHVASAIVLHLHRISLLLGFSDTTICGCTGESCVWMLSSCFSSVPTPVPALFWPCPQPCHTCKACVCCPPVSTARVPPLSSCCLPVICPCCSGCSVLFGSCQSCLFCTVLLLCCWRLPAFVPMLSYVA